MTEYVPGVPCETTVAGAPFVAIVWVPPPIVSAIVIFPAGHPSTLTEAVTVVPDPEPVGLSLTVGADAAVALVLGGTVAVGAVVAAAAAGAAVLVVVAAAAALAVVDAAVVVAAGAVGTRTPISSTLARRAASGPRQERRTSWGAGDM